MHSSSLELIQTPSSALPQPAWLRQLGRSSAAPDSRNPTFVLQDIDQGWELSWSGSIVSGDSYAQLRRINPDQSVLAPAIS
jgi:hypothetical protein